MEKFDVYLRHAEIYLYHLCLYAKWVLDSDYNPVFLFVCFTNRDVQRVIWKLGSIEGNVSLIGLFCILHPATLKTKNALINFHYAACGQYCPFWESPSGADSSGTPCSNLEPRSYLRSKNLINISQCIGTVLWKSLIIYLAPFH